MQTTPSPPTSPSPPDVVCIVLNYNGAADTIACVHSLLAQDYPALQLLIVDNASTDTSVSQIRAAHPAVELITAPANDGFASGNNLGIRHALTRNPAFLWLLNNDTIAPPDTLTQLVTAARDPRNSEDPRIGITGTVLHYLHNPAQIQAWGGGRILRHIGYVRHFLAPTALGQLLLADDTFLTFASVLIRRELFDDIGLLDDGYFMYYEDADFCFRARAAGWRLAVAPGTAVLHKEGGSGSHSENPRAARIVTTSGLRFLGRFGTPPVLAQTLYVLSRLAKRTLRLDRPGLRAVFLGVRDYRRNQPRAFQENS